MTLPDIPGAPDGERFGEAARGIKTVATNMHAIGTAVVMCEMRRYFVSMAFVVVGQAQPLSFDVASIRQSPPESTGRMLNSSRGALTARGTILKFLIARAYDLMEFQILGGPGWMGTERYDIMAKSDDADPDRDGRRNRERLQTLLADRFGLRVHRDSKELGIYALVPSKDGPKLHDAEEAASKPGGQMISQPGMLKGIRVQMPLLIIALSRQLERIVLDQTGLKGAYDFQLEWTPDQASQDDDLSRPGSIFVAVQEKLGLKLQSQKGQVPVIVVEHAEKASEN